MKALQFRALSLIIIIMQKICLAAIILLAVLLRFIGINPGFPPIHEDEGITHSQGIAMILERSLDPKNGYGLPYNYPIVVPLVNAFSYLIFFIPLWSLGYLLFHLGDVINLISSNNITALSGVFEQNVLGLGKINVVFWGRYVTAFFGAGVVILSYLLGRKLFDSNFICLLGSFLVAINYRQVLNSHLGLPDIYNSFFLLLALYQIVNLWGKSTLKNYILSGVAVSLYFSTKFQFFALPPLVIVLLFLSLQQKSWSLRIKHLFSKKLFLMIMVMIVTAMVLNIFHIIHWRETLEEVGYSALKYRYGRLELDFYSISYLYHYGIGPLMSWSLIFGIILSLIFKFKQSIFLLSASIPFLIMMIYFTGGGFYTRNFVTVTPILLFFSSFAIFAFWKFIGKYSKFIGIVVILPLLFFLSWESLANSIVVPLEYSQEWNYRLTQKWLGKNLPFGANVITHDSIPLSENKFKVFKAKNINDYILPELQKDGINFAVVNLTSFQDQFFWWMLGDAETTFRFWLKPEKILNNTPDAKVIWELKKHIVFEALNPWQAPDQNFLVIKVPPRLDFKEGTKIYEENFNGAGEWKSENDGFGDLSDLKWDPDNGYKSRGSLKIPLSGKGKYSQRFTSQKIPVKVGYSYKINGWLKTSQILEKADRDGFLGVDFISEEGETIDAALSSRVYNTSEWLSKEIIAAAPESAKDMQLFFQTFSSNVTLWLDDVEVRESREEGNLKKESLFDSRFIPEEHLFLNSNGGM